MTLTPGQARFGWAGMRQSSRGLYGRFVHLKLFSHVATECTDITHKITGVMYMKRKIFELISAVAVIYCTSYSVLAQEWPSYGGDNGSQKYSPLSQVDAENVQNMQTIWVWESVDNATVEANFEAENFEAAPGAFKGTPIVVDKTMYLSTSFGRVVALDPVTGAEKWVFDTRAWETGKAPNLGYNTRGVAYWEKGSAKRIFYATADAYLWSINADTGKPDLEFGVEGHVDLTEGLGREVDRDFYGVAAPPLVTQNMVVVNASTTDRVKNKEMPPGHVRAFDPETGEMEWIFHTLPGKGEFGSDTWEGDSLDYTGNTNSWTIMSADEELGIVYIPTGAPTNDWYGGLRLGDNLFADSLIAVDVKTGEMLWYFQTIHHGVWDYDLPAAPTLVDIIVNGTPIKAVAQITKHGFTFVLDRVTGEPIWPIEERPVPASDMPGERLSPTQPFPTKPASFEPQGISDLTLIDFSPELREEALEIIQQYDYGPLFTAPSLKGTILFPGWGGGGNWHGAAFDPETGLFYVPSVSTPLIATMADADPAESNLIYYRSRRDSAVGPRNLPLVKPPYGRITAIDLNTGEHEWMVPHGEGIRQRIIDMGITDPGPVGSPNRTGPLLTKTLLFVAQTDNGRYLLRAFDKASGEVIAEIALPLPPGGTPMTYSVDGKQFISIAVGGAIDSRIVTLGLND